LTFAKAASAEACPENGPTRTRHTLPEALIAPPILLATVSAFFCRNKRRPEPRRIRRKARHGPACPLPVWRLVF
jgi:hypothetical protein